MDGTFQGCNSLTTVSIPNNVTSIGYTAFGYCHGLTAIDVSSNNMNYASENGVLFNKAKTILIQYPIGKANTTYTTPDSVISIGGEAFSACSTLTSVSIGNSVVSIGDWAFGDCENLTSVTIGSNVVSIGDIAL